MCVKTLRVTSQRRPAPAACAPASALCSPRYFSVQVSNLYLLKYCLYVYFYIYTME